MELEFDGLDYSQVKTEAITAKEVVEIKVFRYELTKEEKEIQVIGRWSEVATSN